MKKIISCCFVILMIFISVGCSNNNTDDSVNTATPTSIPTEAPTPFKPNIQKIAISGQEFTSLYLYEYCDAYLKAEKDTFPEYDGIKFYESTTKGVICREGFAFLDKHFSVGEEINIDKFAGHAYVDNDRVFSVWSSPCLTIKNEVASYQISVVEDGDSYIVTYYTYDDILEPLFTETKNLSQTDMVEKFLEKHVIKTVKENVLITYETN